MKLRSSFQLTSNKASGIVLVLCNWSLGFAKALAFLSKFTRDKAHCNFLKGILHPIVMGCQIGTRLCVYKSPFTSQNYISIVFSSATYISIRSIVLLVYPLEYISGFSFTPSLFSNELANFSLIRLSVLFP